MQAGHRLFQVAADLVEAEHLIARASNQAESGLDWSVAALIRKAQEKLASAGEALVKAKPLVSLARKSEEAPDVD